MDNNQDDKKNEVDSSNQPQDQSDENTEVKTEEVTSDDSAESQDTSDTANETESTEEDSTNNSEGATEPSEPSEKKISVADESADTDNPDESAEEDGDDDQTDDNAPEDEVETKPEAEPTSEESETDEKVEDDIEAEAESESESSDDNASVPSKAPSDSNPSGALAEAAAKLDSSPAATGSTSPQMVFGKGSQLFRNLVIAVVALLLITAGTLVVMQLTKEDAPSTQAEVVKNEISLLRISAQEGPLNLFYTGVSNDGANMVNNHMYEGLVTYENINKIVPLLADSWTNPNDETWIFKLKENVKFHNGEVMTAEDVKAALDQGNKIGQGNSGIDLKSVKVVDPSTVEVVTNGPDPLLLGRLAGIWVTDASAKAEDGQPPVGTGPYAIKAGSEPGANELTLSSFEGYHDGTVYTKELNVQVMSTADAVKAFNEGKIDIATTLVSDSEDLNRPDQQLVTIKDFTVAFLSMNGSKADSPLAKVEVRRAIATTLNPEPIIEAQKVIGEPASQFVTRDIPGFNTDITGYERNIEAAKELLSDAGYPNGFTVSLTYASASNDGQFNTIKAQLAEIGITVTQDGFGDDHDGFFAKLFSGQADLLFLAYSPEVLDASDTFNVMFGAESALSYKNTKVVDLLGQAAKTLDEQQRLGILKQIGQELFNDVAAVPLYSRDSITALAQPYAVVRHMPNGGSGFKFNQVYLP